MKLEPLVLFIVWWIFGGWNAHIRADFTVRVDYSQTPSGVPMGDTILKNGSVILLNYSGIAGQPDTISFGDDRPDRNLSVSLIATPLKVRANDVSIHQFEDMDVSKVVSMRTEVSFYARTRMSDGVVVSNQINETFLVDADYSLNVAFGFTATSAVREYQYYFNSGLPEPLSDGSAPLGAGDFVTTDANEFVPWSVIAKYGTGSNFYGIVRVVDFAGKYSEGGFQFDIHPTAVPEPSTWWTIAILGSGYAGRTGWKRWRQKRSQRDGEIEGAAR